MTGRRSWPFLWPAIGVLACARAPGAAPIQAPGAPVESRAPLLLLIPQGPAAAAYESSALAGHRPERDSDPLVEAIVTDLQRAATAARAPDLLRDQRLDRAAGDLARWAATRSLPAFDAIRFLLVHYGIVEVEPLLLVARGDPRGEAALLAELRGQLPKAFGQGDWRRLGVGVQRGTAEITVVLALQEQKLELARVPRRLRSAGPLSLAGRLLGPYSVAELLVVGPSGNLRREILPLGPGRRFRARFSCDAGDGAYQIEINASDARGPTVLANFPVFCGIAPPVGVPVSGDAGGDPQGAEEAERDLLVLVNRDRTAAGLPPLVSDPRLARIARAYSREMARTGQVVHVSATTGSVIDRLRAAAIVPFPTHWAENVGSARSPAEVERGFLSSPGHRASLLAGAATHVGIGVAAGTGETTAGLLFFTQIFAGWQGAEQGREGGPRK